jgi:anti-anti-sigma factor
VGSVAGAEQRVAAREPGMSIEHWSDSIIVVDLQDDPAFTDDLVSVTEEVTTDGSLDVVLSFAGVHYLNSSNLAKLVKLQRKLNENSRRLVLCAIDTKVWGIFMVTGLDKMFQFADDVATSLAMLQIASP